MESISEDDPDYLIEQFWLGFKTSMKNFYSKYSDIVRPINYWSIILNKYKTNKNYDKIQESIFQYIILHMIDIMRVCDIHRSQLLDTFIKRWETLSSRVTFFDFDKSVDVNYQIFRIYLKMLECDYDKTRILFSQPELYIFYNNFTPLIQFSIENNTPSILDRVKSFTNVGDILHKLYAYDGNCSMRGVKLVGRVRNHIKIHLES